MTARKKATKQADVDDARARYDELVEERRTLPEARKKALHAGDRDAFFDAEHRLAVIDEEILQAETTLASQQFVELANAAEESYVAEQQLLEQRGPLEARVNALKEQRPPLPTDMTEVDKLETQLDLARAIDELEAVDQPLFTCRQETDRLLARVDEAEERYLALAGPEANQGEHLAARPGTLATAGAVHAHHPDDRAQGVKLRHERATNARWAAGPPRSVLPGETLPRWLALRLTPAQMSTPYPPSPMSTAATEETVDA